MSERKGPPDTTYLIWILLRLSGRVRPSKQAPKSNPKNMDYECEKGVKRNTEPWGTNGGGA